MRTLMRDQFTADQRAACKPKIIARNTFRYQDGGCTVIRLHATDIVRELSPGRYKLDSGGWRTMTTKDRMQGAIGPYRLWQDKGQWFVGCDGNAAVPYYDGMVLPDAFKKRGKADKAAAKELKLRAAVKKFCNRLDGLKELPVPSNGDCWFCCLHVADGKDKGKALGDVSHADHILSHIKEGYLHGSLIMNALTHAGYGNPCVVFGMEQSDRQQGRKLWNGGNVKRALRRYLHAKLGLVS